jgi:small-conductance mechanosensitive channel
VPRDTALRMLVPLAIVALVASPAWPELPPAEPPKPSGPPTATASAGSQPPVKKTEAERIVELERSIADTERQLTELKTRLDDPESEYAKAKAEFTDLDKQLEDKKKQLKELQVVGQTDQAAVVSKEIESLQKPRDLAKDRFDLAIQEQNALREKIGTLEKKLQLDREAVAALQAPPTTQPAGATTAPAEPPASAQEAAGPSTTPATRPPEQASVPPVGEVSVGAKESEAAPPSPKPTVPPSPELVKAQEQAQAKQAEAKEAEAGVRSINERIETLKVEIENERKLLVTARKMSQNAREQQAALREQVRQRVAEGAPRDEINEGWDKVAAAEERHKQAQDEVRNRVERIDKLNADLLALQAEQIAALEQAEQKRQEADAAEKKVKALENPFNPENMKRWVLAHGPRLVGIIVGMIVLLWFTRVAEHRIVRLLVGRTEHGARLDRENRARTLASAFRSAAYIVIIVGGVLMVLTEIKVDVAPLLGGAAVAGLAVAFGAQNLIKDYFYGFIILLENQYTINDVVKIGDTAGLVERITLRMTVLRDLEGVVHFVPHGEATRVSNLTHGWSRTVLDIGVAYHEDADHVMKVLAEVGKELYEDPEFRPLMLGEPEILGLDAFGDSAIVIKLMVQTRPLKQWTIKREFLRRIKKRFDELGIEIPFPHRTIYHRWEPGQPPPALAGGGAPPPTDA